MKILELIKGTKAKFMFYRQGHLYYKIVKQDGSSDFMFPIDITNTEDIGAATFNDEYGAITLMRYIRKAMEDNTLVPIVD